MVRVSEELRLLFTAQAGRSMTVGQIRQLLFQNAQQNSHNNNNHGYNNAQGNGK